MKSEINIILKNKFDELSKMSESVNSFAKTNSLNDEIKHDIKLALDEIITNIISYAFDDDSEHEISVKIHVDDKNVFIKIEDDGKPFNPLEYPQPDTTKPLEERDIGGLGVFFVRELMNEIEYERKGNKNILTVTKSVIRNL
ncbi:MAG: ATP-binding protein [Chlamydiae bacterium]|nr:MAG: ATP-binding protein [Chlamydiota bacterium]